MPLIEYMIEPVNISRVHVPKGMPNDLECVANHTLANVIRELSSLSKYAEDMFQELSQETTVIFTRVTLLQQRIEDAQDTVTQLIATEEEGQCHFNLQDIHSKKPFKSSVTKEQKVISRSTIPRCILEMYNKCETLPPLDKLNVFREDGKDSMKFYTDPTYFVELWAKEMDKQIEENKSEINKRRGRRQKPETQSGQKKPRQIKNSRDMWNHLKKGKEFSDHQDKQEIQKNMEPTSQPGQQTNPEQQNTFNQKQGLISENTYSQVSHHQKQPHPTLSLNKRPPPPPPSLPPRLSEEPIVQSPYPPPSPAWQEGPSQTSAHAQLPTPPPSPPPPLDDMTMDSYMSFPPPPPSLPTEQTPIITGMSKSPPPAPPPPPPPPPPTTTTFAFNGLNKSANQDSSSVSTSTSFGDQDDRKQGMESTGRNALLAEIIQVDRNTRLRTVETRQVKQKQSFSGELDIQALLERATDMRRRAIEDSDDEDDAESADEDNWDSD